MFNGSGFTTMLARYSGSFVGRGLRLVHRLAGRVVSDVSCTSGVASLASVRFVMKGRRKVAVRRVIPSLVPASTTDLRAVHHGTCVGPRVTRQLISGSNALS